MKPILTIMLPTTEDRNDLFQGLVAELQRQRSELVFPESVELIMHAGSKEEFSIGAKRQLLLESASGTHVVGFDSDDWPAPDYLREITDALRQHPNVDHVGFWENCNIDGATSISKFSIEDDHWHDRLDGFHARCANPKSVIRRELALQVGFEDMRYGEDQVFSEKVTALCKSEVFIDKQLYFYRHISTPHNERYGIK